MTDPIRVQYKTSSNLQARINLHEQFSTSTIDWTAWVFNHMLERIPAEAHLLELGCGTGKLWRDNLDRIPAEWHIEMTDFSQGMLSQAEEALSTRSAHFRFQQVDATSIPFDDASFDTVIANHMLYHVPNLPKTMSEIYRVLKPGGVLFSATNGPKHMAELNDLREGILGHEPPSTIIAGFRLDTAEPALRAEFEQVELHRFDDGLAITEVMPIVDYVFSRTSIAGQPQEDAPDARERLVERIQAIMTAHDGVVHISKETGLFISTKP